MLDNFDMT